jgi:RNA polymerase primary sigma factor
MPEDPDNPVLMYIRETQSIPPLTQQQEAELNDRILRNSADEDAKRKLTSNRSRLDLIQDGNIGLMKALNHFDHRIHGRFADFAIPYMRNAINDSISD